MLDEEIKKEPEETKEENDGVTVDLDKKSDDKPEEPTKEAPSEKYVTPDDLEKVRRQVDGLSYLGRKFEDAFKKLDSFMPTAKEDGTQPDDYDELVQKDWKQAVRKLASDEYAERRKKEIEEETQLRAEQDKVSVLEQSRQAVRDKYPEIDDPGSEISQRFTKILNSKQEYLKNEYGPLLTMREVEDELRSEGRLDEFTKKAVEKEVARRTRAQGGAVPRGSKGTGSASQVTLTKDQKELCDFHNIPYENYASNLKKLNENSKEGVEVQ